MPSLVEDLDDRAARGPADGRGIERQVVRGGDRRLGDLGRAVQVVDHGTEGAGRPAHERRTDRRARDEDHPQAVQIAATRSRPRPARRSAAASPARRPSRSRGWRRGCRASPRGRTGGARPSSSRAPAQAPAAANPSVWNIGVVSSVVSRACSGIRDSRPPTIANERGSSRGAPFGVPVVPLVRITSLAGRPAFGGDATDAPAISASSVSPSLWSGSSIHASEIVRSAARRPRRSPRTRRRRRAGRCPRARRPRAAAARRTTC